MKIQKSSLIGRLLVIVILCSLFASYDSLASMAAPSSEPAIIPSSFFDPYSVGWASVRNMTDAQFSTHFAEMSRKGFLVIDIEVDEIDGEQRVGAVWQKNIDGRGWFEYRNLTDQEFHDKWTELNRLGYRLIDQEGYVLDNSQFYAGVWVYNTESLDWASYRNMTSQEFSDEFDRLSAAGFMLIDFDAYPLGSNLVYAAVWVENVEKLGWQAWRNMSDSEFSTKFNELKDNYRMLDVESYYWGGKQYYAGIWVENVKNRAWFEYRDMTAKQFGDTWLQLRDAGYRLVNYETYPTANGWRYAGIWWQNGNRPIWPFKEQVDDLMEGYADEFDIPGMSVAVVHNGEFVYLRGFGFADVDDEIIAHSRTLFRLASISKAVAGVLSLQLSEEGLINLGNNTSSYIPGLPAHHTHQVNQTITNRSGIGHYDSYTTPNGQFNTALDAADDLWNVALEYTPGNGYLYSTHAYTFLGAAIEGAVGQPLTTVYNNQLREPFNLNSLQPEDRSVPHPFRSSLYNTSNQEVQADNLSWKVLGGGMESSAFDLARFGEMVNNGTILEENSINTMWTAPDGFANYGYGWDVGTNVVGKLGAQNGARAYLRIYPDDELVILVMTNRKNGGHDPRIFCIDIADIILNNGMNSSSSNIEPSIVQIDEIDEPEMEAMDPDLIIYPVDDPVAKPTADEIKEDDNVPVNGFQIHLPMLTH